MDIIILPKHSYLLQLKGINLKYFSYSFLFAGAYLSHSGFESCNCQGLPDHYLTEKGCIYQTAKKSHPWSKKS